MNTRSKMMVALASLVLLGLLSACTPKTTRGPLTTRHEHEHCHGWSDSHCHDHRHGPGHHP